MKNTPLISVIIPCYNVEKYLKQCLDSVLAQTFHDYEIICIEDCSTDNTKIILKEYARKYKFQVVFNQANQGLAESRNMGLTYAKGEYIYFLDSDDTISEDCLEILYHQIQKDKSDIIMSQIQAYPENKDNLFCINHAKHLNEWLKFSPFKKVKIIAKNAVNCYHKLHCCAVNKLYKRNFLINNNIYFIHQKCFHEDNGYWVKILACAPTITGLSETTYFYRVRNNSISDKMDADEKKHKENLKLSLKDALIFAQERENTELVNFIKSEIYRQKKHPFISFFWAKNEKQLKILLIPIFRFKLNVKKQQGILKILGIPVFKWRKKNG